MFLNSTECFIENCKYLSSLCKWEVEAHPKRPATSRAEPGSNCTPPESSTVLLWHLKCSSSCHRPRAWKECDRHFIPDFVLVKELWWISPPLPCATATFDLYPSLLTLVTEVVFLFYFLVLNCCKINWKTTIMYPVSFFCLFILGLFVCMCLFFLCLFSLLLHLWSFCSQFSCHLTYERSKKKYFTFLFQVQNQFLCWTIIVLQGSLMCPQCRYNMLNKR